MPLLSAFNGTPQIRAPCKNEVKTYQKARQNQLFSERLFLKGCERNAK
jgi:hypothetical protein